MKELSLSGKDYFTVREAAHYCCVSESQFKDRVKDSPIPSATFMGKRVFRRNDLQRAIEEKFQWQVSLNAGDHGSLVGKPLTENKSESPSVVSLNEMRIRPKTPKK